MYEAWKHRQVLSQCHAYSLPKSLVFLEFKDAFVSVDRFVLSKSFSALSDVRQGCFLPPILFNVVIDGIMIRALQNLPKRGVHVITGEELVDLEYEDDILLLDEDD